MSMKHSYATGAATGTRAQYATIGGTDSLSVSASDTTGVVSVVANSSTYGANAIQLVTDATASDACRIQVSDTNGQTEFRAHWVMDIPSLTSGQWVDTADTYAGAIECHVSFNQAGAFQFFINAVKVYDSGNSKVPAAGTQVRFSWAMSLTTWSVAFYTDSTNTLIANGSGTTAALSGTFGLLFLGKVSYQSATNVTLLYRAVRVEAGTGCSLALLPAESLLTPAKGNSIVPIRLVSTTGSLPVPTGATAVTNLSDGATGTTVVLQAASGIRLALRPMAIVGSDVVFLLPSAFADATTILSVNLRKTDGTQVGTTKTVSVGTTAATASVTFLASEMSGLATTDWEGMQLEVLVP